MENVKEVPIYKAGSIGNQIIPDVSILIAGELPDFKELKEHAELYDRDAEKIVEALRSLPGGTWNRVLVKMLERQLSYLRISLFPLPPEAKTIPICYGQDKSVVHTSPEYGHYADEGVGEEGNE